MASEKRFGFEWDRYSKICSAYEEQFKHWVSPMGPEDFRGKRVLDAGCGMGRNSYWSLKWGAKEVVAFDHDERSVKAAAKNLSEFPNANVLFKSIYDESLPDNFDFVFSIGVIHHLKNPRLALKNLVGSLRKNGKLLIWVYSYEGNAWIVKLVDPIRKNITSKLPVRFVHILSYFCSMPLWIFVKIFKGPSAYCRQLATFSFWHIHSIVFDQLIPEVANYWKKEELRGLFECLDVNKVEIFRPANNCGWTIIATKG